MPSSATSLAQESSRRAIDRVPAELWAETFKFVDIPDFYSCYTSSYPGPGSLNPENPLLIINNVCTLWRKIVQSLPSLWSTISLHDCWKIPEGLKKHLSAFISTRLNMLSDILQRSRDQPLHIMIGTPCEEDAAALIGPSMLILTQECHRWTELAIHEYYDNTGAQALITSLSLLEIKVLPSLELIALKLDSYLGSSDFSKFRGQMPKLRELYCSSGCPLPTAVPWVGQLTSIELEDVLIDNYRQVLPFLQSAVSISIQNDGLDFEYLEDEALSRNVRPFVLPALKQFHIQMWDDEILSLMMAPSLQEMEIVFMAGKYLRNVAEFNLRSKSTLTKFSCGELNSTYPYRETPDTIGSDLWNFLTSLPRLEILSISKIDKSSLDALLGLLCERENGRMMYCRRIQDLTIRCDAFSSSPALLSKLLDVFEARLAPRPATVGLSYPSLRSVDGIPEWNDKFSVEYKAMFLRLDEMKREGLEVNYTFYKL